MLPKLEQYSEAHLRSGKISSQVSHPADLPILPNDDFMGAGDSQAFLEALETMQQASQLEQHGLLAGAMQGPGAGRPQSMAALREQSHPGN